MKLIRFSLVAVAILLSTTTFAQKFGYINSQELIASMPERDSVQVKLTAFSKELSQTLEAIQVEFNNKLNDYQKVSATLTETIRGLKEKELNDLQARYSEFEQTAQQDMQKMQNQLMMPVITKADDAIKRVSKSNAMLAVFDISSGALAYQDDALMTNLLPLVKKELGIVDKPAAPAAAKK